MARRMTYVIEGSKRVPVVAEVDVVIAGAGISGTFAAIACGRMGAKTLVVDRFGSLGGNIGASGMIWAGSLDGEAKGTLPGGLAGLSKEFCRTVWEMIGKLPRNLPHVTSTVSYLANKMMKEAKVELMLSSYAAAPILKGNKVCGLFVETASGRVAVLAKVTVDATGEGAIAMRGGAPMIRGTAPKASFAPIVRPRYILPEERSYDDTGLNAIIGGIDEARFTRFHKSKPPVSAKDKAWAVKYCGWLPAAWTKAVRKAYTRGEFKLRYELSPLVRVMVHPKVDLFGGGFGLIHTEAHGCIFHDDWKQMTMLESALRSHAYDYMRFVRKYIPGLEKAYLLSLATFLGTRGGPCIEAEYSLRVEESIRGARFDDALFVNIHEAGHGGAKDGYDVPYRILLPKKLDGLLVTGRGAGYLRRGHDPSGIRARPSMMVLGEATGVAAALAARDGVVPKKLNVRKLQRTLVSRGIFLGDEARLKQLGVA